MNTFKYKISTKPKCEDDSAHSARKNKTLRKDINSFHKKSYF